MAKVGSEAWRKICGDWVPTYDHRQVSIASLDSDEVDEKIADVIDFLIINGCSTSFSCQGESGNKKWRATRAGYISFYDKSDLELAGNLLSNIAVECGDLRLADRVLGGWGVIAGAKELGTTGMGSKWWLKGWVYEADIGANWANDYESSKLCRIVRLNHEDIVSLGQMIRSRRSW